jgi:hypothetical protein
MSDNWKKYNITLCVLACAKNEKYKKRLLEFINEYGYKLTSQDIKVKFVFLVDDEPKPDFVGSDFVWYNCSGLPMSCRFLKYIKDEEAESEWTMQVDDDSSTDIDKTIELLDQFYDSKDAMILMGGRNTDLEMGQQNILRFMKVKNVFFGSKDISKFDTTPYFIHAWEPSILSHTAINRMKAWKDMDEFYGMCLNRRPTFGDQVPYVAAKLARVPIVECLFMSPFSKSNEYSAINANGRFSHIHYITDRWPDFKSFKESMRKARMGEIQSLDNEDLWDFHAIEKGKHRNIGIVKLDKNGSIGIYSNENERYWEKRGESIVFMNSKNIVTAELSKISEDEYRGDFILDKGVVHVIKKM